jgi:hypothetical protein
LADATSLSCGGVICSHTSFSPVGTGMRNKRYCRSGYESVTVVSQLSSSKARATLMQPRCPVVECLASASRSSSPCALTVSARQWCYKPCPQATASPSSRSKVLFVPIVTQHHALKLFSSKKCVLCFLSCKHEISMTLASVRPSQPASPAGIAQTQTRHEETSAPGSPPSTAR